MKKNKLIVMVGLQGSGKSTWAKEYQKENENVVIVSSDLIRKEEPNWNNEQVFQRVYLDINIHLTIPNTTVILDATNLTLKSRRQIFNNLKNKRLVEVSAVVVATPIDTCIKRVRERNKDSESHYVPEEVVWKYALSFQIPLKSEGFEHIIIIRLANTNEIENIHSFIFDKLAEMKGFEQKNPHHTKTLENHCSAVGWYLSYNHEKLDNYIKAAGFVHDYGKLFTQTFDDKGIAHYYGHAEIGAYKLLSEEGELNNTILEIVNYHMLPYGWNTEKAHRKWKNILGENLYNELLIFNKTDREAH